MRRIELGAVSITQRKEINRLLMAFEQIDERAFDYINGEGEGLAVKITLLDGNDIHFSLVFPSKSRNSHLMYPLPNILVNYYQAIHRISN